MFKNEIATSIFAIDAERRTPKYLQIVHSVTKAIKQGRYKKGDRIVSINQLSNECFLSRDTVQKAYDLLERDRIIEAVKGKGFYISRTDIVVPYRVLLIFNCLDYYKKVIYDAFVQTLGNKAKVELKIHHSNAGIFAEMMESSIGLYDYYVIAPHFIEDETSAYQAMQLIPTDQLIVLDKEVPLMSGVKAGVFQDFEQDIITTLETALPRLYKYQTLVYIQPDSIDHPIEMLNGFRKFCMRNHFPHTIKKGIREGETLHHKEAYIVIEEDDLVTLLKNCKGSKMKVGKDVGILSYNDTALKEVLSGGISVISPDHAKMGETAARLILENRKEKIHNPFTFTARSSL